MYVCICWVCMSCFCTVFMYVYLGKWYKTTDRRNSLCILPVLVALLSPWLQADPGSNAENSHKIRVNQCCLFCFSARVQLNISLASNRHICKLNPATRVVLRRGYKSFLHSYHNMVLVFLLRRELLFSLKKKGMDAFLLAFSFLFLLSLRPGTKKDIWCFALKRFNTEEKNRI